MYQTVKPLQVDEKPPIPGANQRALSCSENALSDSYNNRSIGSTKSEAPGCSPSRRQQAERRSATKSNDSSDDFGTEREPLLSPADLSNAKGPRPNQSINRLTLHSTYIGSDEQRGLASTVPRISAAMARSERYFPTICSRPLEFSQVISKSSVSGRRCTFKFPVHGLV